MFAWIARRRGAAERAEKDAIALIAEQGAGAYDEARRRERDASDAEESMRWRRAEVAIARQTGRRVGLDAARRRMFDGDRRMRRASLASTLLGDLGRLRREARARDVAPRERSHAGRARASGRRGAGMPCLCCGGTTRFWRFWRRPALHE